MAVTLTPFSETLCIIDCDVCHTNVMVSIDPDDTPADSLVLLFATQHESSCQQEALWPLEAFIARPAQKVPAMRRATP